MEQLTPHVAVRDEDIRQIAGLRYLKRFDLMDPCPQFTDQALNVLAANLVYSSDLDLRRFDHGPGIRLPGKHTATERARLGL